MILENTLMIALQLMAIFGPIYACSSTSEIDDLEEIVLGDGGFRYYNTYNCAYWFEMQFILECFSLLIFITKILYVASFNRVLNLIFTTIKQTGKTIGIFVIIIAVILVTVAIVAMNLWGPYVEEYTVFTQAFISTLLLSIATVGYEELVKHQFVWTFLFMVMVSMMLIYVIMSAFLFIFIDSFRIVVLQQGQYYQRIQSENKKKPKRYIEFLQWFFAWMPEELRKKLPKDDI